ncbi:hypothetical protein ACTFIR_005871 [Dictyostelium discoideum]
MEILEILFWKVFKNKYIFKEIFNQIHNNEWIEYDEPNKYNVNNRCKFGDTHLLQTMIKNDLLPLIKDKIKHDEFEITDLIRMAVKAYSPDFIRLLVNEPYSVIIYPTTFEFAITDSNLETIKELVNLESINFKNYGIKLISEEFKRESLSLAAHRKTLKTTITEYIFNNPSLYSIPPPLSSFDNQKRQELSTNKRLKRIETLFINLNNIISNYDNNDNDNEEIKYEYIEFNDFKNLKSTNLLKSFMELDIVLSEAETFFNPFLTMYHSYERLQVGIKVILKYGDTIDPNTNEFSCFSLRSYLNFELFTYDYILGRELNQYSSGDDGSNYNNKKYITQLDTILKELIKQLSFDICTNVSNRDRIVKGKDFFNHSINADLKFSLDIGRKDLFWELLDWIEQYMIKNENLMKHQVYQFNSPYESLLPTGTIYLNVNIIKKELTTETTEAAIESTFLKIDNFEKPIPNESTIKIDWNSNKLIEPFKPISKLINSFKFSNDVIISICKVMNVNEIQRFIQYNFFESFFQNEIYKYSILVNREDLMSFLLNNYKIDIDFPYFHPSSDYSQYLECKFFFENHFEKVMNISNVKQKLIKSRYLQFPSVLLDTFSKYICKENNITTYDRFIQNDNLQIRKQVIKETIEILIGRFLSSTNDDDDDDDDSNQNFASLIKNQNQKVSLIQSIIEQSDTQLYFKSALDQVLLKSKEDRKNNEINSPFIENNKNPFLQSFIHGNIKTFDNCKNLINNFKNDNNLLKHLKNQLSKHPMYKYNLTWL